MDEMGMDTMMLFMQEVVRIDELIGSLPKSFVTDPTFMPQIVNHVGIPSLVDWIGYVSMMTLYSVLHAAALPVISPFVDSMQDPRNIPQHFFLILILCQDLKYLRTVVIVPQCIDNLTFLVDWGRERVVVQCSCVIVIHTSKGCQTLQPVHNLIVVHHVVCKRLARDPDGKCQQFTCSI
jgi:hypothetical protein